MKRIFGFAAIATLMLIVAFLHHAIAAQESEAVLWESEAVSRTLAGEAAEAAGRGTGGLGSPNRLEEMAEIDTG